ncbi:MAG TPA: SCP-2 sterol transfer family protein [Gammaproteobacteria bacterium]|nr:SCP-2 sterol transfer family protein [Gammaproteobacteria bacterium]
MFFLKFAQMATQKKVKELGVMSELFGETWMQAFALLWNTDPEITNALYEQRFNANIGYGLTEARHPIGVLIIIQGKVKSAGLYQGEPLDWDVRASIEDWENWLNKGLGLARLGMMLVHKKLQFQTGDARKILRTPRLATAFWRTFDLMSQIDKS